MLLFPPRENFNFVQIAGFSVEEKYLSLGSLGHTLFLSGEETEGPGKEFEKDN